MKTTSRAIYFWGGIYSNWYPSEFEMEGERFSNSEQAFMWKKAITFKDYDTAKEILNEGSDPKVAKKLGRGVKNFNDSIWNEVKEGIMYQCVFSKFNQNDDLKRLILATGNRILVEASPYDKIWGVGLKEDDPRIEDSKNWLGENLLGKVLERVRLVLKLNS